jgi:hypothetical protein
MLLNSPRINVMWVVNCCVCVHSAHGEQPEIPRQLHNPYQYNGADYDKEGPRGDIQLDEGEEEGKFSLLLQITMIQAAVLCYLHLGIEAFCNLLCPIYKLPDQDNETGQFLSFSVGNHGHIPSSLSVKNGLVQLSQRCNCM